MELPAPVATQIRPPDPQAGIDTYAKILGIKQAQQNLQTGAYAQQEQAATAQQQQQTAKQRAALANWDFTKYDDGTGVIDTAQAAKDGELRKAAGDSFPSLLQQLNSMRSSQLQGKKDYLGLQGAELDLSGKILGGFANDEDVKEGNEAGRQKIINGLSVAKESASPEFAQFLDKRIGNLKGIQLPQGPNKLLLNGVRTGQLQALDASSQASATTGTPGSVQTTEGLQPTMTAPAMAGGGTVAAGPPIRNATSPGTFQDAAGQVHYLQPGGAPGGSSPTGGGVQPHGGGGMGPTVYDVARYKAVTDRVQQAQTAANNTVQAQDALGRALTILRDPNAPNTGGGAGGWLRSLKNAFSTAGIDTEGAENINTLVKNLARYEAARATQAGLGGTDAARDLAHNGSPSVQLDNKALKGIVMQSMATEQAMAAYAKKQATTRDPEQQIANETAFRNIPHMIEGYEYLQSKSKEEANDILQKSGLKGAEMKSVIQKIKAFDSQ